jgi:hypothetical protein
VLSVHRDTPEEKDEKRDCYTYYNKKEYKYKYFNKLMKEHEK